MDKNQDQQGRSQDYPSSQDQQAVDKAPGEEVGQGEQVTKEDLTGKKVDRDPTDKSEEPIRQTP
jgi:hypothetical protein